VLNYSFTNTLAFLVLISIVHLVYKEVETENYCWHII